MDNTFDRKFTFFPLLKFAFPCILMQLYISIYSSVDGFFVSRYVGTTAFSGLNIAYPLINLGLGFAIMLAVGAGAYISKEMGEQKFDQARKDFSFLTILSFLCGVIFTILGLLFLNPILKGLGATDSLMPYAQIYARISLYFMPVFFVQVVMSTFFVAAGHPKLGLLATFTSGTANIILDYLFVYLFDMGIAGASLATGMAYCFPVLIGFIFFTFKRNGLLYFVKPAMNLPMILKSCLNGCSEMVTNISFSVTMTLFNIAFMKYYGEDGVAAIGIILYVQYAFVAIFFGYTIGVSPVLSYKYGANDKKQMHEIVMISIQFIILFSIISFVASLLSIKFILNAFAGNNLHVYEITMKGFYIFAIAFLFSGFGICASAMFTSLSNGKVSAIISFGRTFVFLAGSILLLPLLFNEMGLWWAVPVSEILGTLVSIFYFLRYKNRYGY
ncbi:MAG: MATE family efflux transporter [Holdemanella sp.]|nr:MATE family efflux transporter [Holdemanella sp.]